ncbi:MAG: Ig-like domain-containing protein [Pseudomonadota bacterium]
MSYRNRTGLCGLLIACTLAVASACGGLDSVKVVVTPDDGGAGNPSGGNGASGSHQGGAAPGAGETSSASGAAGAAGAAGEAGAEANGGEGGQIIVPDPMPGAPTVVAVSPKDKLIGAEPTAPIRISFSEPLDPASVTGDSVQLKDESGALVSGAVSYADAVATFTPAGRLNLLGNYTVNVSAAVTDAGKTAMEAPFTSSFTVKDGVWGKAEASLTTSTLAFDRSSPLALATDGASRATAVWAQITSGSTYDVYAALFVEGKGWGAPTKINTNTASCQYPTVAMNASGNVIVGWIEYDATTLLYSVQARRSIAGTWDATSTKIDIPPTTTYTVYPGDVVVAINANGHAHVAWDFYYYDSAASPAVDYYGVYARHVDAAGVWDATNAWLTSAQVGSSVSPPAFAFDAAGNGFAAYQFTAGTPLKTNTIVQRYLAATNKWGTSAVASTPSDGYAQPVGVATNPAGDAVLSWERDTADTTYDLMGSHYSKAWSAPVVISTATTTISSARTMAAAAWTGTSFLVAWAQSAGTPYDIYANEYKTGWGTAAIISDGNHTSVVPQISADGRGNALAVWYQQSDTAATTTVFPYDVAFSRFTGAADKWTDPARLSSAVAGYRYPQIVTLADGTSIAAWQRTVRSGKISNVNGVFENDFQ